MSALPRTPVGYPAPTWWLTAIHDSSSRGSGVIFLPPWPPGTGVLHTGWQRALHIQVNLNVFNDTILLIVFMVKLPSFLELVHSV